MLYARTASISPQSLRNRGKSKQGNGFLEFWIAGRFTVAGRDAPMGGSAGRGLVGDLVPCSVARRGVRNYEAEADRATSPNAIYE